MKLGELSVLMLTLLLAASLTPVYGDRCVIPGSEADIYNPGQKAIIVWNGSTERLILSTDLSSSTETKVLELLPLPSMPRIEEGSFESFEALQDVIWSHMPPIPVKAPPDELRVVFHEKIGAHDVTVVEAESDEELAGFIRGYADAHGLTGLKMTEEVKEIIRDYLGRGFRFWVFDLLDLESETVSIDPLAYEFETDFLYYPLKVSSAAKGETRITLYMITRFPIEESMLPSGFRVARYGEGEKVRFRIRGEEIRSIDMRAGELVEDGWLTAAVYEGPTKKLDADLRIKGGGCRSISVELESNRFWLGDDVEIEVDFIHLAPGCMEIAVLHHHKITLEVLGEEGVKAEWSWVTRGDLHSKVVWRPDKPGVYTVRARSWFNGESLEVEDVKVIEVVEKADTGTWSEFRWFIYGASIASLCFALGMLATYLILRRTRIS